MDGSKSALQFDHLSVVTNHLQTTKRSLFYQRSHYSEQFGCIYYLSLILELFLLP